MPITESPFGTPRIISAPDEPENVQANGQDDGTTISEDDPRLTAAVLDVNQEADAYAVLPPLPAGRYRVKLRQLDVTDAQGHKVRYAPRIAHWIRDSRGDSPAFYFTALEAIVEDTTGKYDGLRLTDNWVTTLPDQKRYNASPVATILRATGTAVKGPATAKQWMDAFQKALAAEPDVQIDSDWEWNCQFCTEAAKEAGTKKPSSVVGMHRFPQGKLVGTHDPAMRCPKCQQFSRGRARITGYFPIKYSV